ncbi:MAG TPA: decarboxylating 6-phosphogluconate dehydrogenase [Candidatus Nanoarchaeia archaeon]|nr:decarboxylating 6-phosphogluconate dehydrogenase [Candidatus Nanoarchaeia archaeon]
MKIGFIGLGRMGFNMVLNLKDHKIGVVAYNRSPDALREIKKKRVEVAFSVKELIEKLPKQKIIWIMVTAGKPVDDVIEEILPYLNPGDIIIDGGNSFYKDSIRRYNYLKNKKINFLDIGTSGGLSGARNGACLTIGGDEKIFRKIEPVCKAVSVKGGYAYVGPSGAGHFVKMVHNGIEYSLLQACGEGFELLMKGPYKNLDFEKISKTWKNGSIIRSYLIELAETAFKKDSKLNKIEGVVGGGETGQWTVETANEFNVDVGTIKLALEERKKSQSSPRFAGKVVAALRNEFGGHEILKKR